VFEDPLQIVSCDLPLGWVPTGESSLFRLVFKHIHRPCELIVLSVHSSLAPSVADEEAWITAAGKRWAFPPTAAPVEFGGATGIQGCWQEDDVHRTRLARRGAGLDLVLEYWGDSADDRMQRGLLRLAGGARLPVEQGEVPREEVEQALAAVDQAAADQSTGGEVFRAALVHATDVLTARWQSTLARDVHSADLQALADLLCVQLRHAAAAADARRLLRLQVALLRAGPLRPPGRPYLAVDEVVEGQACSRLSGMIPLVARAFARIRARDQKPEDPRILDLHPLALRLVLANYWLANLRKRLGAPEASYDREDALAASREVVDATLAVCVELRSSDSDPGGRLSQIGEPLVTFIDVACEADRMQDVAEAATLLCQQACLARSASADERAAAEANRFLLIGRVAQATALVSAADEASLREALDLLDLAAELVANAGGDTRPDQLNVLHLRAQAALWLGDLDRARTAAQQGKEAAIPAGDNYQREFFDWVLQAAQAVASEDPRIRTYSDLILARERAEGATLDVVMNRLCGTLLERLEENPLSLATLECLVTAGQVVEPAQAELQAAARALLDLRRLLMDRNPDLRVGSDDSLLARQLAAGHVEERLREQGADAAALAVDHACGRSLVLDLASQPALVARLRGSIAQPYPDLVRAIADRVVRQRPPPRYQLPPPWAGFKGPSWLRQRATHLRQFCTELTGVVGGAPLTEAEMRDCADRHGEPILLLYPVEGKMGGFLLRPGRPAEFDSSGASVADTIEAVERLRSELGVWKSGRSRHPDDWLPPADVVAQYLVAAADVFEKLLAPFVPALSGETRLTIVPYRELATVPFAVLSKSGERPLCERLAVTVASSISMLRVLQSRETPQRSRKAFVLGDPDTKDPRVPRLAGAAEEARRLADQLRGAIPAWDVWPAPGEDATPAVYRARAADADLVHLACHGSVGNVARDAALLLSPNDSSTGRLRAPDIEAVRLRSALVFLAACRSGTGRPTADGTIGLSRVFLTAGAAAVVASLWNVPDESTRILVDSFYGSYLSGVDVASALQRAMIATRDELTSQPGGHSHDVHLAEWGAFFVLGRGGLVHV
jgi:hypothetical protein